MLNKSSRQPRAASKVPPGFFYGKIGVREGWLSGLRRRSRKPVSRKRDHRFKSCTLRQFSEFEFWAITASPRQRRGSASARILKGFLKSKNNFCPLKRKFKPIFFRKSRPCSGFSCKAIISACFTEFMNLAASSNRLLPRPLIFLMVS